MKRHIAAAFAIAMAACASRSSATSTAVSPYAVPSNQPGVRPKWSVSSNVGRAVAIIDGAVVTENERIVDRQDVFGIAVYDIASGKQLWRRDGLRSVRGTPLFLEDGQSLERVDVRSGRVLWRSREL